MVHGIFVQFQYGLRHWYGFRRGNIVMTTIVLWRLDFSGRNITQLLIRTYEIMDIGSRTKFWHLFLPNCFAIIWWGRMLYMQNQISYVCKSRISSPWILDHKKIILRMCQNVRYCIPVLCFTIYVIMYFNTWLKIQAIKRSISEICLFLLNLYIFTNCSCV